jgi:PPP family 3-phenylpropionic acid transporter
VAPVFFFLFAALGALTPFLSLHYHQIGLSATEIGLLMSVMPFTLLLSQPIFGPMTDRSGHRGRMLGRIVAVVALAAGLVGLADTFWILVAGVALWGFVAAPMIPIADSIALGEVSSSGGSYPRLRLWGSIGFLVTSVLLGQLYTAISLRWAFLAYGLLMLATWYFTRRLPAEGISGKPPSWVQVRQLVQNPYLLLFLVLTGIMQMTQAAHSLFFSLHLEGLGGSRATAGLAWGLGALVEVPVWWVLSTVTRKVGSLPLLTFAGAAYALRWWLYSTTASASAIVWLQLLQGISYAIFMPTAVRVVGDLTPPELRTSGQALLVLVNGGIATIIGTLTAGRVVDAAGTGGLYLMLSYVAFCAGLGFMLLILVRARLERILGVRIGG